VSGLYLARIRGRYRIVRGEGSEREILSGGYDHHELAEAALSRIEAAERLRTRACLRCGAKVASTGPHHRMCDHCRRRHAGLDAQMLAPSALPG